MKIEFRKAVSVQEFEAAKALFEAYARGLGIDLSFQDFSKELHEIDTQYREPEGILFLMYLEDPQAIGCVGIRKWNETACELKRMYIREAWRGHGLGRQMLEKAIEGGRELGYTHMRLDTLPTMKPAIRLYRQLGFREIAPYRFNPIKGTKYFELTLNP